MRKSETDVHWNDRAVSDTDDERVNIDDTTQRDLEFTFIEKHLEKGAKLLEIGCGNGFLTRVLREHVQHVDAFDQSEHMIERARSQVGELNSRFFNDNILDPSDLRPPYDIALCVRVLINLRDLGEQKRALENIAAAIKPGGKAILVEGFLEGFGKLNELRASVDLQALSPASINCYSRLGELMPYIESMFEVEDGFHSGLYDLLTRVVYPSLVGAESATGHSDFHLKIGPLVKTFNVAELSPLARVHGFCLRKK